MKVTQMLPVHAANRVANSGNTAYGVDVLCWRIYSAIAAQLLICYQHESMRFSDCDVV